MLGVNYQLSDYLSDVRTLIHDLNASDYSDAALIPIVNNARRQVARDLRCVRQMISGLSTIPGKEVYPLTGFVGGYAITAGGHGYTKPTVTLSGGGGVGAAAVATADGGVLTSILPTSWGGAYTSTPAVTIADPTGSGAAATAIAGTNILDLMLITGVWPGNSLAVTFSWLPFDGFQAFCRSYRQSFGWPGAYTVHYGPVSPLSQAANAQSVYMYPIPQQAMGLEFDALTTPPDLASAADVDYWIVSPWFDAVQYYAASRAFLGLQQFGQAKIMRDFYDSKTRELPSVARARRVHNFYALYRSQMRRI